MILLFAQLLTMYIINYRLTSSPWYVDAVVVNLVSAVLRIYFIWNWQTKATISWSIFSSYHTAQDEYKPEEADLFLTMAQLKDRDGRFDTTHHGLWFWSPFPHMLQIQPHQWFISDVFLKLLFAKLGTDIFKFEPEFHNSPLAVGALVFKVPFLPPADAPCPLVQYITDAALNSSPKGKKKTHRWVNKVKQKLHFMQVCLFLVA